MGFLCSFPSPSETHMCVVLRGLVQNSVMSSHFPRRFHICSFKLLWYCLLYCRIGLFPRQYALLPTNPKSSVWMFNKLFSVYSLKMCSLSCLFFNKRNVVIILLFPCLLNLPSLSSLRFFLWTGVSVLMNKTFLPLSKLSQWFLTGSLALWIVFCYILHISIFL